MMPSGFHPIVSRWFLESIGEPTSAQRRGWDAIRAGRHTLIAAPTGSGKTLAAFLTAIDDLVREGSASSGPAEAGHYGRSLPDEVRVVYVSPLKALSADIHKNLAEPRRGIRRLGEESGIEVPRITAAVRTGDTTSSERAAMLRTPPHILVTTPESLYLLLTAERSRQMLRTVRAVIVDEIHAVIGTRRGAHLALTLERLEAVCAEHGAERPRLQRIGLSATQKPIGEVARFLVGNDDSRGDCAIVDEGHRRTIDLAVEVPPSPLTAVMAHEVWEEVLRPAGHADCRAQDHARLRQHSAAGGARREASQRPTRRRGGHRASRQPVEGAASRRRASAEDGSAQGAGRNGVTRTGDRHRPRRSGLSDRIPASHCHAVAARRQVGTLDCGHAQGPDAAGVTGRPRRVRRTSPSVAPRRPRRHRLAGRAARRAGAADHRGDLMRQPCGG